MYRLFLILTDNFEIVNRIFAFFSKIFWNPKINAVCFPADRICMLIRITSFL